MISSSTVTNPRIIFILLLVIGILGVFYTLIRIISEEPSNFDYQSDFCFNITPESTSTFVRVLSSTNTSHYVFNFAAPTRFTTPDYRKIFFIETSGKSKLNSRQACAVESAARQNEDMQIIVYFISPTLELNNPEILTLIDIPNISFQYLNLNQYFKCSPLNSWHRKKKWRHSPYKVSHMSDALRFLTLWKYGGIYLDLDVVVIKPLNVLRNCAGKESEIVVTSAVMAFEAGHEFLLECLKEFSNTYSGVEWGWNGPHLITRVFKRVCGGINSLDKISRERCMGVLALPSNAFNALEWEEWRDFFNSSRVENVMNKINDSYLIHVWNKHSSSTAVKIGSGQPYDIIAKRYCPMIHSIQKEFF